MAGGAEVGGSFAAMIVCGALALAVRGRIGASNVFPWRACCYAPLALFERAISVYWALFRAARLPDEQQTNWGQAFDVR